MKIRCLGKDEVKQAIAIICERIRWMDEMHLRQWNVTYYLSCYPYSYFESLVAKKELYGAFEEGKLIGIAALFSSDERWQGAEDALYVHHLAVLPGYSGTGAALLSFCEQQARNRGKSFLRLDAQKGNERLNDYYEKQGFTFVCEMIEGAYEGIKRQKKL